LVPAVSLESCCVSRHGLAFDHHIPFEFSPFPVFQYFESKPNFDRLQQQNRDKGPASQPPTFSVVLISWSRREEDDSNSIILRRHVDPLLATHKRSPSGD